MNIQYGWETFPPWVPGATNYRNTYTEIMDTKVIPLIQGSGLRPAFPRMWVEWTRMALVQNETNGEPEFKAVDCAALLAPYPKNGEGYRVALSWESAERRQDNARYAVPMIAHMNIPYDLLAPGRDLGQEILEVRITGAGDYLYDGLSPEERDQQIGTASREQMWTLFWSMLLLSCNNVTAIESQPNHRSNKRHKDPLRIIHKELHVQVPPGGSRKQSVAERDEQAGTAFHVRRGHFADYTKGKGLFGKYHGKYWVPATTVGDVEYGTVVKNYKLEGVKNA